MTSRPSSTRRVDAASAAMIVQPSWIPSALSSDGPDSRWSQTHSESRPTASACWPKARTCGQVGMWPGPSDNDMGTTTPIRMPPSLGSRDEGEEPPGVSIPAHLQAPPTAKHDSDRSMRQR
jgi:hypothetical protein